MTEGEAESKCDDWDPEAAVAQVSSTEYEIDQTFVDYIVQDPLRLANCDAATVVFNDVTDDFELKSCVSGTLLYELGFRSGDVVSSVNGYGLTTVDMAAEAFGDLYLRDQETEYAFVVERGGSPISIEVVIVP